MGEVLDEELKKNPNGAPLEVICNVLDKKVYSFVEWARDSSFFDSLDVSFAKHPYTRTTACEAERCSAKKANCGFKHLVTWLQ